MSAYLPAIIDLLTKDKIEIVKIFIMGKAYYLKNKPFFDKMISVGLSLDLEQYLKSGPYDHSVIDNINAPDVMSDMESYKPDLIINNGMMFIYGQKIIKKFKILNTHSGNLPFYRGRCAASWAIYNGADKYGISCHLIDEGIDTGPIISQEEIKIEKNDYVRDLLLKEKKLFPFLIKEAIGNLNNQNFVPKLQNKYEGTFFPALKSEIDGIINWQQESTKRIFNKIRAFSFPYGGAFTIKDGVKYIISRAITPEENKFICAEPGLVLGESKDGGMKVSTIDGYILVHRTILNGNEMAPVNYWKEGQYVYTSPLKEYAMTILKD
tara:strand:+ start:1221 stop:2189 length:969 start_codon:yes stop_codon:yes gene_type:complete